MIPRVAQSGRSFKGAARYYLHDKKADTSDRVAFAETINLPTEDPRRAVAHMIDTASHATELKQAAGVKSGRKLEKPVYSYSLAWHPTEAPTKAEQIAAARETIAALGLADRQALIVAHNDTDHAHVHVIVNRVHPETGKAASLSNDQLTLSRWAQAYEEKRGKVFCDVRVENNDERTRGQWKKDDSPHRKAAYEWKKQESGKVWSEYRAERDAAKESRKGAFDALWKQRVNRVAARKAEVKELARPHWQKLFKSQKRSLGHFDAHYLVRMRYAIKQTKRRGIMPHVQAIFSTTTLLRHDFLKQQEQERKSFSAEVNRRHRDAAREVDKAWKYDRDQLRASFAAEDANRLDRYKSKADSVWNKGKGKSAEAFERVTPEPERTPQNTADMVRDHMRKSRGRAKGRTRKRER